MKIKALLLDFDGTTLQHDQTYISFRNMHALQKAMEQGCQVIPCTGRAEDMFPPQIEADSNIRYWITSSGTRIVDRKTNEVIYSKLFTPEESEKILKIFTEQQIYSEIAAQGKIYMEKEVSDHLERYDVPDHHVWYLALNRKIAVDNIATYFLENNIGIEKVNIYGVPKEKQKEMCDRLNETGIITKIEVPSANMQFFPKRLDKAKAVQYLLDKLEIDYKEVMSIGDSIMDLPVIERAGIGVAMGNAPDWIKEVADDVTGLSDEDGVAQAIHKHILRKHVM